MTVTLIEYSNVHDYEVPAGQWASKAFLPDVGDQCVVVVDDHGDAWVPLWGPPDIDILTPLLALKEDKANKGVANGYAPLDSGLLVPLANLPVDSFPQEGAKGTVNSGSQTIATANNAVIALPSEDFDTNALHDTVTNNSRLTIRKAGIYSIQGMVRFSAVVAGLVLLEILRNNATPGPTPVSTTNSQYLSIGVHVSCAVNDYLELRITNSSGATVTIANAWLSAVKV